MVWASRRAGSTVSTQACLPRSAARRPIAAAAVSLVLAFRRAPPVAFVSGSMGALIGADLLNLRRIGELGAPIVSIGGAGTFDGVFLTGILAGLLA